MAFRSMEGWSWVSVNYELWLNAAQQPQPRVAPQGRESPFLDRVPVTDPPAIAMRSTWASNTNTIPVATGISYPLSTLGLYVQNHKRQYLPVSPAALSEVLQGYDVVRSQHLVNGFSTGFGIGCASAERRRCHKHEVRF